MKTAYLLIGVPAAGKSTWIAQQQWAKDHVVVSTDAHIEKFAVTEGKTYNEVFNDRFHEALSLMLDEGFEAIDNEKSVIVDQTNLTRKVRAKKIKWFKGYKVIAVVFSIPKDHEVRLDRPGKLIPAHILKQMIKSYEEPTKDEGFDEIWYVS